MSDELAATLREAVAALASADRGLRKFGAPRHRYELLPVATALPDLPLPDDYRAFVTTVGRGGAGPAYGLVPLERAATALFALAGQRALPLGHFGCGYAMALILDGPAAGEVWLDASVVGAALPLAPSFEAFYVEWVQRLAHNALPDPVVPPGVCAVPAALSGYLAMAEARAGLGEGELVGAALRGALGELGPGAIEIAADRSVLFSDGDRVDPCLRCALLIEHLAGDGLARDVIASGIVTRLS